MPSFTISASILVAQLQLDSSAILAESTSSVQPTYWVIETRETIHRIP